MRAARVRSAPEVVKIEPVVRIAAAAFVEHGGVALDAERIAALRAPAGIAVNRRSVSNTHGNYFAAIESRHEEHRAAQGWRCGMGPVGKYAASPSSVTACTGSSPRVRSPARQRTRLIETFGDIEHGVDAAQGDDIGYQVWVMAARVALILRAFSSYMAMVTRSPR